MAWKTEGKQGWIKIVLHKKFQFRVSQYILERRLRRPENRRKWPLSETREMQDGERSRW